jgi:hypothetical protein
MLHLFFSFIYSLAHLSQKEYIRKWLEKHGVLPGTSGGQMSPACDADVEHFENNHTGGPVAGQVVRMHWKSSFSSLWNRQAVHVLASAFLEEHVECGISLDQLKSLICRKLERTRQEWNRVEMMQTEELDRRRAEVAKKNRRKGRLVGVRSHSHICRWLLKNRCCRHTIVAASLLMNILTITLHSGARSSGFMMRSARMA